MNERIGNNALLQVQQVNKNKREFYFSIQYSGLYQLNLLEIISPKISFWILVKAVICILEGWKVGKIASMNIETSWK